MNKIGVISVQLDRELRAAIERHRSQMKAELGREVRDAEIVRVLLRRGLDENASLHGTGYIEGWRAGSAEAKEAHARALADARRAASRDASSPI